MKRILKAMQEGVCLIGKDDKEMDLPFGKMKELSEAEWKNFCEDVRKKIGSGTIHYSEVKNAKVAARPTNDASFKAKADAANAKAKADADAKAKADAAAKVKANENRK